MGTNTVDMTALRQAMASKIGQNYQTGTKTDDPQL